MKKLLFFSTLLAFSLFVLPKVANAETYTLTLPTAPSSLGYGDTVTVSNFNGKYTGIWLDSATPQWWDTNVPGWENIDETNTNPAGRNVYHILTDGTILLTDVNKNDGSVSAVLTNDSTGEFNLGNISISGITPNNTLYGFLSMDDASFAGTVKGGNVNVNTTDGSEIVGVYFRVLTNSSGANGSNKQNFDAGADIAFNDIRVKAGDADSGIVLEGAAGFAAGNVDTDASINIRSVTAEGAWATGLEFAGGFTGELKVAGTGTGAGIVKATSTGNNEARGLLLIGGVRDGGKIDAGSIEATAKEDGQNHATAVGVYVGYLDPTNSAPPVFGNLDEGSEIKVGEITVSGTRASGIFVTGGTNGKLDIGSITATGVSDVAAGFWSMGSVGTTADLKFGNIYVTADDGAQGIAIGTGTGDANFEGKLTTGRIDVYSETNDGTGTTAGISVDGNFIAATGSSIGSIRAEATTTDNVYGIVATAKGNQGKFGASDITVINNHDGMRGDGGAFGIAMQGGLTNGSNITSGTISVTARSGNATGIGLGSVGIDGNMDDSTIAVSGNISATARSGNATGIDVNDITDSEIRVTGTGNITATTSEGAAATGILVRGTLFTDSKIETTSTGTITANGGSNGDAIGIDIQNDSGVAGEINLGNVSVTTSIGTAAGYRLNGDLTDTGTIANHGTITATSTGFNAYGMWLSGGVSENASITVGSTIRVDSRNSYNEAGGEAVGISITENLSGTVTVGNVEVNSNDNFARGILLEGTSNTGTVTVGNITVTSTGDDAYGIHSSSDANITLKSGSTSNIIATGTGENTAGIYAAGETTITLSRGDAASTTPITVNITGRRDTGETDENGSTVYEDTAGIWSGGSLNINIDKNNLTTKKVKVEGKNLTVTGGELTKNKDGNVTTKSVAKLGIVDLNGGNIIIGDNTGKITTDLGDSGSKENTTTVGIDFVKGETNLVGTANELHENGILEVTGVKTGDDGYKRGDILATFSIYDNLRLDKGNYKVYFDASGNLLYGGIDRISDIRLAALTLHNRNAVWHSVRDRLISGSGCMRLNYEKHSFRGQNPCDPRALYAVNGGEAMAWVNYTGRSDSQWSPYYSKNWELSTEGIQAGTDLWRTRCEQLGILFGYETGKTVNSNDSVKVDDPYFGVYAARVLYDGTDVRAVFAYGWQKYNMKRFDGGTRRGTLFQGHTSETHLELGRRLAAGSWSLRPVFGADVFTNDLNAIAETNTDIYYGKTNLTQVFLRAGSDLRFKRGFFTFNGGAYYSYDVGSDASERLSAAVWERYKVGENVERDRVTSIGSKLGRSVLTFNGGGECLISKWFSVIGGYQGEYAFDRSHGAVQHTGYVGGAWQW